MRMLGCMHSSPEQQRREGVDGDAEVEVRQRCAAGVAGVAGDQTQQVSGCVNDGSPAHACMDTGAGDEHVGLAREGEDLRTGR